jgi:hypothetical protein
LYQKAYSVSKNTAAAPQSAPILAQYYKQWQLLSNGDRAFFVEVQIPFGERVTD